MAAKTKTFIVEARALLNSIPSATGDMARLAHFLSEAVGKIEAVACQADAQFACGDTHATFNKQFIQSFKEKE